MIVFKYDQPPTKLPFVIWASRDGLFRIVCVRIAAGTADFEYEHAIGADSMGVARWGNKHGHTPDDLIWSLTYDLLDEVCPNWRGINA